VTILEKMWPRDRDVAEGKLATLKGSRKPSYEAVLIPELTKILQESEFQLDGSISLFEFAKPDTSSKADELKEWLRVSQNLTLRQQTELTAVCFALGRHGIHTLTDLQRKTDEDLIILDKIHVNRLGLINEIKRHIRNT